MLSEQQVIVDNDVVHRPEVVVDEHARGVASEHSIVVYGDVVKSTLHRDAIIVTRATGQIIEVVDVVAFDDGITSFNVDTIFNVINIVVQKCSRRAMREFG